MIGRDKTVYITNRGVDKVKARYIKDLAICHKAFAPTPPTPLLAGAVRVHRPPHTRTKNIQFYYENI